MRSTAVRNQRARESCVRHKAFPTYEAALAHYVAQVREGRTDPGQRIYVCQVCRKFHHGGSSVRSLGRAMSGGEE